MTLGPDRAAWPDEALDYWHERAGVREYLGNLPRPLAERLAHQDVLRRWEQMGANAPPERTSGPGQPDEGRSDSGSPACL